MIASANQIHAVIADQTNASRAIEAEALPILLLERDVELTGILLFGTASAIGVA